MNKQLVKGNLFVMKRKPLRYGNTKTSKVCGCLALIYKVHGGCDCQVTSNNCSAINVSFDCNINSSDVSHDSTDITITKHTSATDGRLMVVSIDFVRW